jgi:uncharacterized protein with GYD domain
MPLFVVLYKFTDQGRKTIKDSPKRFREVTAAVEKMGGKVLQAVYTTGRYDLVVISEAPTEEIALRTSIAVLSAGNAVSETLHAYTVDEFEKLVSKLPP